jgi:AraC-like DNA-binding protein
MNQRLGNILSFIHQNPNHELNVNFLAKKTGMSRTLFISYFKQVLGVPPKKYIIDWKLSLSKDILLYTDKNILNIALELGYQSESSFGRAFKLKFGLPPSKFRLDNMRY